MTNKILFENGAEIELKYDDNTYYNCGASEMTELEIKLRIADIILEYNAPKIRGVHWIANEQPQLERELDNLVDQLLERRKKHEQQTTK